MFEYFTLDDFEFNGKIVGVRVDINSPVKNDSIMMNQRIKESVKTLKELQKKEQELLFYHIREEKERRIAFLFQIMLNKLKNLLIKLVL